MCPLHVRAHRIAPVRIVNEVLLHVRAPRVLPCLQRQPGRIEVRAVTRTTSVHIRIPRPREDPHFRHLPGVRGYAVNPVPRAEGGGRNTRSLRGKRERSRTTCPQARW